MNIRKGILPVETLSQRDLEQCCQVVERKRRSGGPTDLSKLTRAELIARINSLAPIPQRLPPRPEKKPRMRNRGVGKRIRALLTVKIGRTPEGQDEGMSYGEIVKVIQAEFPDSMADERHIRWYATQMRAEGLTIPVHRKRSKWL